MKTHGETGRCQAIFRHRSRLAIKRKVSLHALGNLLHLVQPFTQATGQPHEPHRTPQHTGIFDDEGNFSLQGQCLLANGTHNAEAELLISMEIRDFLRHKSRIQEFDMRQA
jgi:hypothetical protein